MSTLSRATGTTRERRPRDFYPTIDPRAAAKLAPHLKPGMAYVEPCAGAGHLIDHLATHGMRCVLGMDIEPGRGDIMKGDALGITGPARCPQLGTPLPFITNPPWDRKVLHPMIDHLAGIAPTWLLFDAGWKETNQAAPFGQWCVKVVSVVRLRWVPDSPHNSTDDCSWYLFDKRHDGPTEYVWPAPVRDPDQALLL